VALAETGLTAPKSKKKKVTGRTGTPRKLRSNGIDDQGNTTVKEERGGKKGVEGSLFLKALDAKSEG